MSDVISLAEAQRPEFTERQREFCKELIGVGLTHLTITGLVVGESVQALNHAQISACKKLISECSREVGFGVMDARRAQSPFTQAAVKAAARNLRVKIKIA